MIFSYLLSPAALVAAVLLYLLTPAIFRLRDIPGPFPAAFTNIWLLLQCRCGRRFLAVDEAHKMYGPFVRIQPKHVSVALADAIPIIYGHGNGFLKSEYYDAFVSIRRGLFNTRDRAEHTRKRKIVSHTFSARSVAQFEQYIHGNLLDLVEQWDVMSSTTPAEQYTSVDALSWFNYLAFDIIGDLAFGAPFGMLKEGRDVAEVRKTPDAAPTYAPAIQTLNRRGEVSATLGCLPWLKPYAKYLPDAFFRNGLAAVENLTGMAVARVNERLRPDVQEASHRVDLLARLMEGRDEAGERLGREELTAEALTQLIAGSDTTSNTSCAILYWVLKTPGVFAKLRGELDSAVPSGMVVPKYDTVKGLPYLKAVINETLRIHSTSSLGLPRLVPAGPGVVIRGHHFPAGTTLSVPSYTIHHSTAIWGADADAFRPERWASVTDEQRAAFIPFSTGPRACVGRNVAEMELALIVTTVCQRYDFELRQDVLETREGFLRKPLTCVVGLRRRK
ncbi:MAG: hypothetical protein M1832_001292 [Thelocarpon impressellum]|nr:MAG: hypothetical protein M1832_001292 [Thelocarpon impressellum]